MDDRTAVRVGFDLVGEVKVRKGDDEVGNCTFSSEAVGCPSLLGVPLGCCAFAVDDEVSGTVESAETGVCAAEFGFFATNSRDGESTLFDGLSSTVVSGAALSSIGLLDLSGGSALWPLESDLECPKIFWGNSFFWPSVRIDFGEDPKTGPLMSVSRSFSVGSSLSSSFTASRNEATRR